MTDLTFTLEQNSDDIYIKDDGLYYRREVLESYDGYELFLLRYFGKRESFSVVLGSIVVPNAFDIHDNYVNDLSLAPLPGIPFYFYSQPITFKRITLDLTNRTNVF